MYDLLMNPATVLRKLRLRHRGVHISMHSTEVSPDTQLERGAHIAHHASLRGCRIGAWTSIGRYSKLAYANVDRYCSISWDVTLGAIQHPLDRLTTHAFPYVPGLGFYDGESRQQHTPTEVGSDVWIGAQSVVMPGIRIGHGAIVGAGSVVTHDVAPYEVVAGSPARRIRARCSEPLVERLLALAWWTWPESVIRENIEVFLRPLDDQLVTSLETIAHRLE